jgi:hypothetical protein
MLRHANIAPISPVLVTPLMETIRSCVTVVLTGATVRNNPEDGILHSHRNENLILDEERCLLGCYAVWLL